MVGWKVSVCVNECGVGEYGWCDGEPRGVGAGRGDGEVSERMIAAKGMNVDIQ